MSETNPIALVDELKAVLERYIATTLPISRRYPNLAERFRNELAAQDLVSGPYVEALPDFEKGKTLAELTLALGGFLHDALYPMNALANDQLYYRVAPLFARYLKEHGITFGRYTGQVKAGATRSEEEDHIWSNPKLMEALGHPTSIPRNWLLTREEMLADPPKVLITNYAMLEHMLLLPRNAGLFARNSLKFIVLDEIHTYFGAQATEVAFLLRKLKTRLGAQQAIRVFGTSASLSDDAKANEELTKFASDLFGEPVKHVIRGKRIIHTELTKTGRNTFAMSVEQWLRLATAMGEFLGQDRDDQTLDCWNRCIGPIEGLPSALLLAGDTDAPAAPGLTDVFAWSEEVRRVAQVLDTGRIVRYQDLAQQVFPEYAVNTKAAEAALSTVIQAGMLARKSESEFPLLPGRYHMAVNSIEGVVVQPDASAEGWANVRVGRSFSDVKGQYFPLLTCRKCGQPFMEGWKDATHVYPRRPDSGDAGAERIVFWLGAPIGGTEDEEDAPGEDGSPGAGDGGNERIFVQLETGEMQPSDSAVALYPVHTEKDDVERARYVKRCPACGGRATGADAEVVTRMHPGNEALGAVVAQRVLEALPVGLVDHSDPRPSFGRTLLTFSDNRQDAAFFAPYFERTAANVALRAAVRAVLTESLSSLSLPQLTERVFDFWQRDGGQPLLLNEFGDIRIDKQDIARLLLGSLGYEFCTPSGRRNSLEGLGVALVTYDENRLKGLYQHVRTYWPKGLPEDAESVTAICHLLLETVRRERALESLSGVAMNDAAVWGDYNQHRSFDIEGGDPGVRFKWLPGSQANRHNRRSWYLIEQLGLTKEAASDFLRQFWQTMTRPPTTLLKKHAPGFAMDGGLIRVRNGLTAPLYQCGSCGLLQRHVVLGKCSAFRCKGEVTSFTPAEREQLHRENHYLASYEETNHLTLRAREHTASLSTSLREEIERDFSERRLNLLSCTTTMEMGVDLGDLEAVVNLNVPPGIANYQQRTGRAGRRAQAAPFCVTVARNSNYDQSVFREFSRYLGSQPGTPFIHLDNPELFWRHQQSVLLAHFFRQKILEQDINAPSLKHLFGEVFDQEQLRAFTDALLQWVESDEGKAAAAEAEALRLRLPASLRHIGAVGEELRRRFLANLREFAEEVKERCNKYTEKMIESATASDFKKAAYWQRMREDYMGQFLVNQLSGRGLIPTYSFPVHSLSLEVTQERQQQAWGAADVALTRDASQGISEYAPGAEVVANGRIWASRGLAHYPKAFMPERWYVACPECFHVDIADAKEELPPACSNCGSIEGRRKRLFIEPRGFVTSYAERKGRDPGGSRRRVKAADEARLIASPRDDAFAETDLPFLRTALLNAHEREADGLRGTMFIANRGVYSEGYFRCKLCNFSGPIKPAGDAAPTRGRRPANAGNGLQLVHDDPMTGLRCRNEQLSRLGLDFVHRFDTDVRLFRFLQSLPAPAASEITPRRFHERLARTIAEALRLAMIGLMQLQPGEVRATYRLYGGLGNMLEVVLYDAVPGGAGYCARIGEAGFSFDALLRQARERLDCPAHCDSGCRSCLCDYGNQRHWDSFERLPALAWVDSLLNPALAPSGPGSYVRWAAPSLTGLHERLANHQQIHLVARNLVDIGTGRFEDSLNLLLKWLQAGKTLHLHLANKLDEQPKARIPLAVYRHLHPYVQDGRLRLYQIDSANGLDWNQLPRIFTGTSAGLPVIRQHFAVQPLLENLIAAPADIGIVDDALGEALNTLINSAIPYAKDALSEGERMKLWELHAGVARDLKAIFAPVASAHVKKLVVRDPYCGAKPNRGKLLQFLSSVKEIVGSVEHMSVYCKEYKDKDGDVEFYLDVERHVDNLITSIGIENRDVEVAPLKGRGRTFHDREVDITTVSEDGCDTTHRYFLTGGIDYLMDERTETRVFYVQL
jgi:hypothetical protein